MNILNLPFKEFKYKIIKIFSYSMSFFFCKKENCSDFFFFNYKQHPEILNAG